MEKKAKGGGSKEVSSLATCSHYLECSVHGSGATTILERLLCSCPNSTLHTAVTQVIAAVEGQSMVC